ncbi:MAG: hypothetical protein AAF297_00250 [Planctomycetota bacterium]
MSESPKAPDPAPAAQHTPHPLVPTYAATPATRRELFWQNVVREMLNGLAATAAVSGGRLGTGAAAAATGSSPIHELFDGRMAVITRMGQRIPIADVVPLFSCSINPGFGNRTAADRDLSTDVQCTVFQITTPGGEVHTLPLHEISSIHALSDHLVQRMQAAATAQMMGVSEADDDRPFGFAAFTSLAQAEKGTDAE